MSTLQHGVRVRAHTGHELVTACVNGAQVGAQVGMHMVHELGCIWGTGRCM